MAAMDDARPPTDSVFASRDSLQSHTDHELMAHAARGDERAFTILVERYHVAVVGTITKMLGNESEAHDLAQQVFLRVWRSAPRFRPTAKFTTWLFTITRNLVFNEVRRQSRARLTPLEASGGDQSVPREWHDPKAPAPDGELAATEVQQAIDRAIAALPEQQRLALILRRYEDHSYEEIAEILQTSVSSVKSLLFRARSELKKQLQPWLT